MPQEDLGFHAALCGPLFLLYHGWFLSLAPLAYAERLGLSIAGPYFVCVYNFEFGAAIHFIQIWEEKVHVWLCLISFLKQLFQLPACQLPSAGSWHMYLDFGVLTVIVSPNGKPISWPACCRKVINVDKEVKSWICFAPWSNALCANGWNSIPSLSLMLLLNRIVVSWWNVFFFLCKMIAMHLCTSTQFCNDFRELALYELSLVL